MGGCRENILLSIWPPKTMDYGTLIQDFKGQLHDVSKNAFDSFAKKNSHALTAGNELLRTSFESTFSSFKDSIASKLGFEASTPLTLENLGDKLKTTARDAAVQLSVDAAVAMAGKYALELEGPLGILISEAASLAIGAFEKQVGKQYIHFHADLSNTGENRKFDQ